MRAAGTTWWGVIDRFGQLRDNPNRELTRSLNRRG